MPKGIPWTLMLVRKRLNLRRLFKTCRRCLTLSDDNDTGVVNEGDGG